MITFITQKDREREAAHNENEQATRTCNSVNGFHKHK